MHVVHKQRTVTVCAAAVLLWSGTLLAHDDAGVIAALELREASVALRELPGWSKPHTIVVAVNSADRLTWLREAVADSRVTLVAASSPQELKESVLEADAMVGPCIASVLDAGTKLRWVQTSGVGVEDCLNIPAIRDGRVMLTNLQRVTASTVAEHAMALVLVLSRQMATFANSQREHRWSTSPPANMVALEGKTMLVVGLGSIGSNIAQRANAFGMRVIATRKAGKNKPEFVEYVGSPDELPSLITRADFVVNSTPLTSETRGLFDAAMFARMRPTAFFVNVGRGRSVVTDDLVAALDDGRIAGAALDVVEPEPLPANHPLWNMTNVVITPHVADQSELKQERSWIVIRENLRRYVAGGKLLSVVDVRQEY